MKLTEQRYAELQAKARRAPVRAETLAKLAQPKRSKYGNKKTIANGRVFASGHEARRYVELELLEKAGEIRNLQRQVPFDLIVDGQHICTYIADAVYDRKVDSCGVFGVCEWQRVVEDSKSPPTRRKPEYRIKLKLMAACHGIQIREIL